MNLKHLWVVETRYDFGWVPIQSEDTHRPVAFQNKEGARKLAKQYQKAWVAAGHSCPEIQIVKFVRGKDRGCRESI